MAYWAKLVEGGKGKRWVLSQKGEQFLKSSPSEQLHTLFVGWWFYANWTETQQTVQWISFLPVDFPRFIYIILTNIPPNKSMEYGNFLKIIKEALNYHWSEDHESRAYSSLGLAIDIIFIDPLEQLGLLVVNRKKIEIEGMTISNKVIDFRLSEFGKEASGTIMDASFYGELKAKLN